MKNDKKSFLYYTDWKELTDLMTDEELRRFINNLYRHADGEEPDLTTREDRIVWIGVSRALDINKQKWGDEVEKRREAGKLGGAPVGNQNARKRDTTSNNLSTEIKQPPKQPSPIGSSITEKSIDKNNPKQPKQPDKSKEISDKREMINEKGEEAIDNNCIGPDTGEKGPFGILTVFGILDPVDTALSTEQYQVGNSNSIMEYPIVYDEKKSEVLSWPYCLPAGHITRKTLNGNFEGYPEWEQDLNQQGSEAFIINTEKYHKNDPFFIDFINVLYHINLQSTNASE